MDFMFNNATAFNQNLCHFGDNWPYSWMYSLFVGSGCPDTGDPWESANGPWCAVSNCPDPSTSPSTTQAQTSAAQNWVHVATLTTGFPSDAPETVSEGEMETCSNCKLSDEDINSLDFNLLRFEPAAPSTEHPITYFDFSNKIFDSTAVVEPCSTPWTLSETDAQAGIFGGQESCCTYTVCNFGRGHCDDNVKSSYGFDWYGGCGLTPITGTSGFEHVGGVRIYVSSFNSGSPTLR